MEHHKPYEIIETFCNASNDVIKYVHANGSETTLKTKPTCIVDEKDRSINKNKAVLFISTSVSCQQNCKFCYLTTNKFPYCSMDNITVIKSAITVIKKAKKHLKGKYLKISFMAMGDVFASNIDINNIAKKVFMFAHTRKYIKGIDGVDIGTSYPKTDTTNIYKSIDRLKETIYYLGIPFNPSHNYTRTSTTIPEERTPVRLFISLHSLKQSIRKELMPKSANVNCILKEIQELDVDIIFHYMLFEGINDSARDLQDLIDFFHMDNIMDHELRLLRFNSSRTCHMKESAMVHKAIKLFKESGLRFKYQHSAGTEIQAACGQFLCKGIK